jgi:hypothetical protein
MNQKFNRHQWLQETAKSGISDGAKLRAQSLWAFANEDGFCWPNQPQIEERIGHKNTGRTSQYIRELSEWGFIRKGTRAGSKGYPSNNYQLVIPTSVGSNSPSNSLVSPRTPENINMNIKLTPTKVGVINNNGKLVPTPEGGYLYQLLSHTEDDYVVDGSDSRPPPEWAVVE